MKLNMKPGTVFLSAVVMTGAMLLSANTAFSQEKNISLEKQWETDTSVLRVPESVYYDAKRNVLFVANIDGASNGKDGKGFISRLSPEGKVLDRQWVNGLNAPKGMGIYKDRLYVADLSEILVIDIAKGSITQRIPVEGAIFLNDIAISNTGVVYVSDTRLGKVHQYRNGEVSTLLEGLKDPNGLLWLPDGLHILADGALFRLEAGTPKKLAAVGQKVDGIEQIKHGEFIVSCWPGEVFYVNAASGTAVKLLDTREQNLNTADIGYDPRKKMVYIPTFGGNTVAAYSLKGL